ncbi:hypothetical protein J3R30DRAFT_3404129 [Lentinula aciculospora]|uniref:Uncharacterized protein n=1 Tax=Lentinula aciculospora TaxID=153920 RepID=A0A9W9DNN0_9AGAR|nr:hypothetical protein J3R30DRAFT_3404129 [Lentinula aciculospora]
MDSDDPRRKHSRYQSYAQMDSVMKRLGFPDRRRRSGSSIPGYDCMALDWSFNLFFTAPFIKEHTRSQTKVVDIIDCVFDDITLKNVPGDRFKVGMSPQHYCRSY